MPCEPHFKQLLAVKQQPKESLSAKSLRVWAPAKINLNLLVGPVRDDGFHRLDSLVAKIGLYDQIDLTLRANGRITFACDGADCGADEQNLAVRAARLLAKGRDVSGVDIELTKTIPVGRGLGGGSSDAAAVLSGLNQLWQLDLPGEQLCSMAAELGSDVPLFLGSPAVRMTGRGEHLTAIEVHPFVAILICPDFGCATRAVYAAFDDQPEQKGEAMQEMGEQIPAQLNAEILVKPPSQWRGLLVNQLAGPAERVAPQLADLHKSLTEILKSLTCGIVAPVQLTGSGSVPVQLTGSGSAMFILCDDQAEAAQILTAIPEPLQNLCLLVQSNPF